jgi:asparagine synthase (glutamine-hydrolysing)
MCGICGIVDTNTRPINPRALQAMRDSLAHRGPNDAGMYVAPGVALGSRRLSVIDLSKRGHMPMSTPDHRYWITYNGEVYNFHELRHFLEAKGYRFRSNTDTEVVLALYCYQGAKTLDRLNGMFAFAIWDNLERTLFLARDRLGVKPLYYSVQNDRLYFASEEKALFAAGAPREFDPETFDELIHFRYIAGERTPFAGIRRLLPGHYLQWRDGRVRVRRWWNLAERAKARRENLPSDTQRWFEETLDSAVSCRRISDVPIGVLLSGGLDSSCVAASLASSANQRTASFTVRFSERDYDEGPFARQVADSYGLDYQELIVPEADLPALLHEASWLNDEPLVHRNDAHLLAISKYAKPRVTVLLSGEGGDELLGGYVRYQPLHHPRLLEAARPFFPTLASTLNLGGRPQKLAQFLSLGSNDHLVFFNACELLPDRANRFRPDSSPRFAFREQILAEARDLYQNDYLRQVMYLDQHTFLCSILDRNDRMTMGASIECRVPFLDYHLVETLAALPSKALFNGRGGKPLLRRYAMSRLPQSVLRHRKWGFGVPLTNYIRTVPQLRDQVNNLPGLDFIKQTGLNELQLQAIVKDFLSGSNRHEALVKQLFMIAVWYAACFGPSQPLQMERAS